MNANWWGLIGERMRRLLGHFVSSDVVCGIPGSPTDHHTAPFSMTEEFVAVYRMHPLLPDDIEFSTATGGEYRATYDMEDVSFANARAPLADAHSALDWQDVFYSFGTAHPGALTVKNFPTFMQDMHHPDGSHFDLGAVDILRDRERGIPRYNQFRRLFALPAWESFEDLCGGDKALAAEVAECYDDDIELVDLMIGCYLEPKPRGFGFSDTAFRVFIVMASRRLKSDRFLSTNFNAETYSQWGIDHVQDTSFKQVLLRHFPDLAPAMENVKCAFKPWNKLDVRRASVMSV